MPEKESRRTYASRKGEYKLTPSQPSDVVDYLKRYTKLAAQIAVNDNKHIKEYNPLLEFQGDEKHLIILTQAADKGNKFKNFNLAELVMSAPNDKLTLKIYKHPAVAIPSEHIHGIAQEFCR